MSVSELNMKLTQEIRELSTKKSKLQSEIANYTGEETKLRIRISKLEEYIKGLETQLAELKTDESHTKSNLASLEERIKEQSVLLVEQQAELEMTLKQIKSKKEQAKVEVKAFIDKSIADTRKKCENLVNEAMSRKDSANAESIQLIESANQQVAEMLAQVDSETDKRRQEADEYYDYKINKAETEYKATLKRASEKHSEKIQDALSQLAELNENISQKNIELRDLVSNQEKQINCLMEIETLLSERQEELNTLNNAIIDTENTLGLTVNSKRLHELEEETQSLTQLIETLKSEHQKATETLMREYETEIATLKQQVETLSLDKVDIKAYEDKIKELTLELELANTLTLEVDVEPTDTKLLEMQQLLEERETRLENITVKFKQLHKAFTYKEALVKELTAKVVDLETVCTDSVSLEERINELETTLSEHKSLLKEKEKEIDELVNSTKLLKINKDDYETVKAKFRELKGDYNASVTNQTSIKDKVIEVIIVVAIILSGAFYTLTLAQGTYFYIGATITTLAIVYLVWSCYKICEKLALAKDMKNTMEFE